MADKAAYQSWRDSAKAVEAIAADQLLAPWQKVRQVNSAYAGMALDGLKSKHRHKILSGFGQVNAVFARYKINSYDDYEKMDEQDLKEIVRIVRSLAPPK